MATLSSCGGGGGAPRQRRRTAEVVPAGHRFWLRDELTPEEGVSQTGSPLEVHQPNSPPAPSALLGRHSPQRQPCDDEHAVSSPSDRPTRGEAGASDAVEQWTVVQSKRRNRPYYFNRVSGQSCWRKPDSVIHLIPETEASPSRAKLRPSANSDTECEAGVKVEGDRTSTDNHPRGSWIPEAPRAKEAGPEEDTLLEGATRRMHLALQDAVDRILPVLAQSHSICSEMPVPSMCSREDRAPSARVVITKSPAAQSPQIAAPEKIQSYREYLRGMSPEREARRGGPAFYPLERAPSPTFSETVLTMMSKGGTPRSQMLPHRSDWSSAAHDVDSDGEWET
jgi:hypothetical protein